ncbi:hypothetical protein CRI94_15460 [Longibacter salinarum]|uniref:Uncharacterized protein n=1 Tax=Longibacter salinarum TaxID=1850348 RepID=A0A2A8CV59_9BACT|nr:hypothetical protein [Longibacter salinarum]PEN11431.1 hypothetical protein CRI94_15460 [Longibacter salinarum]
MDISINEQDAKDLLEDDFPHIVRVTEESDSEGGGKVKVSVEIRNQNIRLDVRKWDGAGKLTSANSKNISFGELIDELG